MSPRQLQAPLSYLFVFKRDGETAMHAGVAPGEAIRDARSGIATHELQAAFYEDASGLHGCEPAVHLAQSLFNPQARKLASTLQAIDHQAGGGDRGTYYHITSDLSRIRPLDGDAHRSLEEALDLWSRVYKREGLLVESGGGPAVLASVMGSADDGLARSGPPLPPETDASRRLRAELMADWLDATAVATRLDSRAKNRAQLPSRYRKDGRLLGVWVRSQNRYLYPPWQFKNGQPVPQLQDILTLLRGPNGVVSGTDRSGWQEATWFYAPHRLLKGKPPADVMAYAPGRVLDVVHQEFRDDPNVRW